MRLVVDINHPAHVHFFKNLIWRMQAAGHQVRITASEKDLACRLLEHYGFDYINLRSYGRTLTRKAINLPVMDLRMYRAVKSFKPDLLLGLASVRAAHAAVLLRTRCVNFDDSEHARWEVALYLPFVHAVCTPACYKRDLGPKQVRYEGYHELAYLHPDCFRPDESILDEAGLATDEAFAVVRFVSWGAVHDVGQRGLTDAEKVRLVRALEARARVFVISEDSLNDHFRANRTEIPPERIHHLLHFARLYVGEGATMATEAGILGTPSLYISSLVGTMGNFDELMGRYDLVHAYRSGGDAINEAAGLIGNPNAKAEWRRKRRRMLAEKVNVTDWAMGLALRVGGGGDARAEAVR